MPTTVYLREQSGGGGTDAGLDTGLIEKRLRLKVILQERDGEGLGTQFLGFRLNRKLQIG